MTPGKFFKIIMIVLIPVTIGMSGKVLYDSKALSYLSDDPKACINCHVMNTAYATWQHSSHFQVKCVECHLPSDNMLQKYLAKMRDGYNHSKAFTLSTYQHSIDISDHGAQIVQQNCIECHKTLFTGTTSSASQVHQEANTCWHCHRSVPHGQVRSITTVPPNLGVREAIQ